MKAPITSAQAMSHPTVVETVNALGEIADELRSKCDSNKLAMRAALKAQNAMLTHMGMDEDDCNKLTFDQMRKSCAALQKELGE